MGMYMKILISRYILGHGEKPV